MKLRLFLPLLAFTVLAVMLGVGLNLNPREVPSPFIGKPAPAFSLPQLHQPERQLAVADLKGQVWLLNVWASWCVACREEHPLLVEMAAQGVEIVGMLYKDPNGVEAAHELLARDGNPFKHIGTDPLGDLGIDIGISGVPESFLIDANGQIVKTKRNYFTEADVTDFVAAYRAEVAKSSAPAPAS